MKDSPSMQPYMTSAEAAITGKGTDKATNAISALPLEQRYIWRIASSLKQTFCDFEPPSATHKTKRTTRQSQRDFRIAS